MMAAQQLVDLTSIFASSPFIYGTLLALSIASMGVWIYSLITFRAKEIMPEEFRKELRRLLEEEYYEKALALCEAKGNILSMLMKTGLNTRALGPQVMIDSIKSEGKRAATSLWQRLSFLNDIVVVAPMFGLLGTVVGMFYAFYDVNRSIESVNALFDGLGIAVGTTVAGLLVAILSMIFHTTLRYRLIHSLSIVENEALTLSTLIRK